MRRRGNRPPDVPGDPAHYSNYNATAGSIVKAGSDGNCAEIRALLAAGVPVDDRDDGLTALYRAAHNGHFEAAALLLDAGADLHSKTIGGTGLTPLYVACYRFHVDVAALLIVACPEACEDVNDRGFKPHLSRCAGLAEAVARVYVERAPLRAQRARRDRMAALVSWRAEQIARRAEQAASAAETGATAAESGITPARSVAAAAAATQTAADAVGSFLTAPANAP